MRTAEEKRTTAQEMRTAEERHLEAKFCRKKVPNRRNDLSKLYSCRVITDVFVCTYTFRKVSLAFWLT
jgi:hypothetical protein